MLQFSELKLIDPLVQALAQTGYTNPTPIQAQAIPPLLEGRDLLGIAQTGTGKTAAFALPILNRLAQNPRRLGSYSCRVLVLTPTRELAAQIHKSFETYGKNLKLNSTVIFGGVNQNPQVKAMHLGRDIVIATPGRLMDLMNQRKVVLEQIEVFVLDEADRMLDMGFINDVRKIVTKLPKKRQNLLFSATMPKDIAELAHQLLTDPVKVSVTPESTTVEKIDQRVLFVDKKNKPSLLKHLLDTERIENALVFTRTKHGANKVAQSLEKWGVRSAAIHGNKSQAARVRALEGFRDGKLRVLVATDIAARGIDIPGLSHVFNFDLPEVPESYVHRIGRTARAGKNGAAFAFCDIGERGLLRQIEKSIRMPIPIDDKHPYVPVPGQKEPDSPPHQNRGGRSRSGSQSTKRTRPGGGARSGASERSSGGSRSASAAGGGSRSANAAGGGGARSFGGRKKARRGGRPSSAD